MTDMLRPRRDRGHGGRLALADVALEGGRIEAIEPDLGGLAASADDRGRRDRVARPAGGGRRPHPHPRRHATPSRTGSSRTRSPRRSAARRRSSRSTTPAPGRPGGRSGRSWHGLRGWRSATAADSAVDFALSAWFLGRPGRPGRRAAGRWSRPASRRQGVHGLRLPARRPAALPRRCATLGEPAGCSRSTARTP